MKKVIGSTVDEKGNFKFTYEEDSVSVVEVNRDKDKAKEFEQCLKEALELSTKHIAAELDNLDEDTIEAILYKVKHEMNLLEEDGNMYDEVPKRSKNAYYKRSSAFMSKWNKGII